MLHLHDKCKNHRTVQRAAADEELNIVYHTNVPSTGLLPTSNVRGNKQHFLASEAAVEMS